MQEIVIKSLKLGLGLSIDVKLVILFLDFGAILGISFSYVV